MIASKLCNSLSLIGGRIVSKKVEVAPSGDPGGGNASLCGDVGLCSGIAADTETPPSLGA